MKPWLSTELRLHNSESALTRTVLLLPTSPSYRDTPVHSFQGVFTDKLAKTSLCLQPNLFGADGSVRLAFKIGFC